MDAPPAFGDLRENSLDSSLLARGSVCSESGHALVSAVHRPLQARPHQKPTPSPPPPPQTGEYT